MFAKLTSLVGGGVTLPFEIGEPYSSAWGQWRHSRGTLKADGSPVSVFSISAINKEDPRLRAARNGVKRLRTVNPLSFPSLKQPTTKKEKNQRSISINPIFFSFPQLRHPNILAFKDTVETEERGETVIYIVTEAVAPLAETMRSLKLNAVQREQYLAMGLNQALSAVSFLNNDCKLIHGGISTAAIVVTEGLDWRLHGFDLVTEHAWPAALGADVPLTAASWMVGAQYKPGEVAKSDWQSVRDGPSWAVDAWGLGCLIQEIYSGTALAKTEDLRGTDRIPATLLPFYQRLLASSAPRRLNCAKILEAGVLKSKLGETMAFLENLALKDSSEKDSFFKRLPAVLPSIPDPVAQRKLLPLLASSLEFGGAPPIALLTLLKIGATMSEEDHARQVVPILTKLFASNDRGIRRGLLENISSYGPALPNSLVEEQIYPNVQTGFGDVNPYLRELTLKSMVVLGPKLSVRTLNQNLLKHLAKLQVDEEPAIRANTTVLLGNIAPQLSDATCKKVLLNAFTRALKDPFPPARAAGLRAVLATAKHHGPEEVATRVIPMVGPLCVDPVQEVRSSALQCLEQFFTKLMENSAEMNKKLEHEAGNTANTSGSGGGGGYAAVAGGSGLLTGFGWAVSSLVAKGPTTEAAPVAPPPPIQNNNITSNGGGNYASSSSVQPPARSFSSSSSSVSRPPSAAQHGGGGGWEDDAVTTTNVAAGNSGWDDGDDDDPLEDMVDAMAAEMEARQKLSKTTLSGGGGSGRPGSSSGSARGRPARGGSSGGGGSVRVGGSRLGAVGGGMKLGVKKLAKDEDDDFNEW